MFEAYKVAVKLTLIENVTAGLIGMSSHFAKAHQDATALQTRLNSLKMPTLVGGALVGAGAFGLHALFKQPLDEAEKYQNILGRLAAQGVGDIALKQADKFAKAQNIIGASNSDTLKMVSEANSVLRNMEEAQAVAPMLLKMKFGIESVMSSGGHGGGHGEKAERMFMDALKTTELRGALIDPNTGHFSEERLKSQLDFMTKAYTASGGLVKPTEYLNMIKTGGIAAKSLNDQAFYFGLMHMAQEQGGSRTGTGLMSAFQNMYMGRTTQQVGDEMSKMGLLSSSHIHYGKTGHITKIDPAALKEAELFRTDQFAYMNQFMLPMLRNKGVKDGEDMKMEIAKLFSNRVGGSQWVTMYMERANIQKHIDAAKGAMGIDALAAQGGTQLSGQKIELQAKFDKLMLVFGENILPLAVGMLEKLNPMLERLNSFFRENGALTKTLIGAFAGLSILSVVAGGLILFSVGIAATRIALVSGALGTVSSAAGLILPIFKVIGQVIMFGLRAIPIIGWVIIAVTAGIWLIRHWDTVWDYAKKIWGVITSVVSGAWEMIKSVFSTMWGWIAGAFHFFAGIFLNQWQAVFNNIIIGVNTLLPKAMELSKLTFADDYAKSNNVDSVRTAQQSGNVTVINNVDEHGVTSMVTRNQSKQAGRAQQGSSGHDGRMAAVSPTLAAAGVF